MANRLADAASPYLLQHADNPVHWREWGEEAFAEARRRDRPVLLSVGYAACHWCHVMAHESFEDQETAADMNRWFVNVKVDREERPDVDGIYMNAVQALTGRGGWPMTVFLTPDGRPFYAGTYFPPDDRPGFPSFRRVLAAVAEAWESRRADLETQADELTTAVGRTIAPADDGPTEDTLAEAYRGIVAGWDREHGGFGGAPKFPQAPVLEFLLRVTGRDWAPEAGAVVRHTLERMSAGGIYDHLGGGFARYAVDRVWLVPHFEKMLYDNALLARLYLRAWQVLAEPSFLATATGTLEYLLRDLRLPGGGFASSEDADSEGEEGRFYVFSAGEFQRVVGEDDATVAAAYFGVSPGGNFEGANVLYRAATTAEVAASLGRDEPAVAAAVERARQRLFDHRCSRVRPGRDDKVVTAWNGLAIRALAEAGAVLGEPRYLEAASAAASFLVASCRDGDGRLLRSWRAGRAGATGFAEDHAALALGLFALYQATGDETWYREAVGLASALSERFAAPDGGFFTTAHDAEELITRPKELFDNPTPSGNSLAAEALLQLALYTGEGRARADTERALQAGGRVAAAHPQAVGHLLAVAATLLGGTREVAVIGPLDHPAAAALRRVPWEGFHPETVLAHHPGDGPATMPLLEGRVPHAGEPLAYVCRGFTCDAPTGDPGVLRDQLAGPD